MTALCRRCRIRPVLAVGLCRPCGLREAQAERRRRSRAERRQEAATRFERRRQQVSIHWQVPAEPEDAA